MVLALVSGRWSQEVSTFVKLLAKAKVRSEPALVTTHAQLHVLLRLPFGLREGHGSDGQVPFSHEVECDFHHAGLWGD